MICIVKKLVMVIVALLATQVAALSLDQAVANLRTFRFGRDTETLQVIEAAVTGTFSQPAARAKLAQDLAQILDTPASYDAKQFVCRQLAIIGTDQQVPALARLLPDPALSHMARYALARIPGDTVDQALIQALDKTKGREKLGLVNTLGNRRSALAVPALERLLKATDSDLQAETITALGRIATPRTAGLLTGAMPASGSILLSVWAQACQTCADRLQSTDEKTLAVTLYRKVFTSSSKPVHRAAALQGLSDLVPEEATALMIKALKSSDTHMPQMAVKLARHIGGPDVTLALTDCLPALSAQVQAQLILALADRGDVTALPVIVEQCDRTQDRVREAALEAIGQLGNETTVSLLAKHVSDDTPACRTAAEKSLDHLRGQDIDPEIIRQLNHSSAEVRASLIGALEHRGVTQAVPDLLKLVQDQKPRVQKAATQALRKLAGVHDLPALVSLLVQVAPGNRTAVQRLIVFLAQRDNAQQSATYLIMHSLNEQKDVELRSCLLTCAGTLGQASTLPILTNALEDKHPEVRNAAVRALSDWPDAAPQAELLAIVRNADARSERVLALRGYIRMIALNHTLSPAEALSCYQEALELSAGPAEKRLILSALPQVKTVEALNLALTMTDVPDLKQDAALTVTQIAARILAQDPTVVQQALEKIAVMPVQDTIKAQARKTLADLEALKHVVLNWEVAGPYSQAGKNCTELFDIRFGPEILGNDVTWQPMPVSTTSETPGYLDLLKALNGGEQCVAYLRTTIQTASRQAVNLEIFSDDGVKVWIDGDLIHANNVMRPIMPDPDRVQVTLAPGTHRLLLKVTQNNLPWGAIVRMPQTENTPVVREERTGEGFRTRSMRSRSSRQPACWTSTGTDNWMCSAGASGMKPRIGRSILCVMSCFKTPLKTF